MPGVFYFVKVRMITYLRCIKPRCQKERKYGVFASVNIIQEAYVHGVLNEQLLEVLEDANHTFDKISVEYIVIFR